MHNNRAKKSASLKAHTKKFIQNATLEFRVSQLPRTIIFPVTTSTCSDIKSLRLLWQIIN